MGGEFKFSSKGWTKALRCGEIGHVWWWVLCDLPGAGARAPLPPIHPSVGCLLSVQPGPAPGLQLPGRGILGTSFGRTLPAPLLRKVALEFLPPPKPVFLTLSRYLWV